MSVLENINIDPAPTSQQILVYSRDNDPEELTELALAQNGLEQDEIDFVGTEDNHYSVLSHALFIDFEDYMSELTADAEPQGMLHESLESWHQCIFDGFNEFLDEQRPYGMAGKPYAWIISGKVERRVSKDSLLSKLQKAAKRTCEASHYRVGTIFDETPLRLPYIDQMDERKYELKEERLAWMLANELFETEETWVTYHYEATEILLEVTQIMQDRLVVELKAELRRLERRRAELMHDEPVSFVLSSL